MSTATPAAPLAPSLRERLRAQRLPIPRPELAVLLVVAAVLDLWSLDTNGWANTYYSAAVRSMAGSWHDFLYASFDAAGVQSVDKPPLALWVQALSVRAFGYSSWSMLVPQALMGVATVALAYDLTRRVFGRVAGFAAGLVLALTPITVAISRHDNPDALVVLCSTAALWFTVRALQDGRTTWLVWAGGMVGLGFEAKMGTALLVLPALALAYFWVAPRGRVAAVWQLLVAGAAMTAVGLVWPVLVWLTPASSRPWVSGTSDNSIWSLILHYNGVGRLDGQAGGPGGAAGGPGGGFGGGGAGSVFGGGTGLTRLVDASLGGQAGWLLGMALVGGIAIAIVTRLRRADARTGWIIAAGGAFATTALAFSYAKGIFHPYYVSMLAPFTAVLVGAAVGTSLRGGRAARVVAPLAILGGVASEVMVINKGAADVDALVPVVIVAGILGAAVLAAQAPARVRGAALAVALGALLLAPASWSAQTLGHAASATFPAGGPATPQGSGGGGPGGGGRPGAVRARGGAMAQIGPPAGFAMNNGGGAPGGGGMFGGDADLTAALAYAKAHGGGTVAVDSQQGAARSIIASGADVAALGGFSGRESQVSAQWLAEAVASGKIRYVLTSGGGAPGAGSDDRTGASELMAIVQQAGKATSVAGLYDLKGRAAAIAAAA